MWWDGCASRRATADDHGNGFLLTPAFADHYGPRTGSDRSRFEAALRNVLAVASPTMNSGERSVYFMSEKQDPHRTKDADPRNERVDGLPSLGRLAEFTRRILGVPKSDLERKP